jgi:hypothetical protein
MCNPIFISRDINLDKNRRHQMRVTPASINLDKNRRHQMRVTPASRNEAVSYD